MKRIALAAVLALAVITAPWAYGAPAETPEPETGQPAWTHWWDSVSGWTAERFGNVWAELTTTDDDGETTLPEGGTAEAVGTGGDGQDDGETGVGWDPTG